MNFMTKFRIRLFLLLVVPLTILGFTIHLPFVAGGITTSTPTPTLTPTPTPVIPFIVNGDFEQGRGVGWSEYSSIPGKELVVDFLPIPPHSGSWAAWFGGIQDVQGPLNDTITTITTTQMTGVSFWYIINSNQPSPHTYCFYDCMRVYIRTNDGVPGPWTLIWEQDATYNFNTSGWTQQILTFPPGKYQLRFVLEYGSDDQNLTNFALDDVTARQ